MDQQSNDFPKIRFMLSSKNRYTMFFALLLAALGRRVPLGGSSATTNVLMNLFAMAVSMGPKDAANRFPPDDRTTPPPYCLFVVVPIV